jgi:hypothetical protein
MSAADTYNVFRHGDDPAILCAVPNDKPVPTFVVGPAWSFETAIQVEERMTEGFRAKLAMTASDLNGFYVFLAFSRAFHDPWIVAAKAQQLDLLAA